MPHRLRRRSLPTLRGKVITRDLKRRSEMLPKAARRASKSIPGSAILRCPLRLLRTTGTDSGLATMRFYIRLLLLLQAIE
jgi:hypothetical protein